jgi:hypothetical protein
MSYRRNIKRKRLGILLIVSILCIATIQISANENDNTIINNKFVKKVLMERNYLSTNNENKENIKISEIELSYSFSPNILLDTEYDESIPSLSVHNTGLMCSSFLLSEDGSYFTTHPNYFTSADNGNTWDPLVYLTAVGFEHAPIDDNSDGFWGWFVSSEEDPGDAGYIFIPYDDFNGIEAPVWDWGQHGFGPFQYPTIACHEKQVDEIWDFGLAAYTGYNGYSDPPYDDSDFIQYRTSEDGGTISWMGVEGCIHTDVVIDPITHMSYAIFDNTDVLDLIVRTDDFSARDEDNRPLDGDNYYVGGEESNLMNPAIEAYDDNVVIVAESNGGIVCFYSTNGLSTVQQSTVITTASYPDIELGPDKETYVCSYVKNGNLYSKISDDGGATWSNEMEISNTFNSDYRTHELVEGLTDVLSVWEDTQDGDVDIYFGVAADVSAPFIEMQSVSGGFGVSAVVTNSGTAAATNIEWSIELEGNIFIGAEKTGTIASLAPGETAEIKTGFILGFGATDITVRADNAVEQRTGTTILFFVIGI